MRQAEAQDAQAPSRPSVCQHTLEEAVLRRGNVRWRTDVPGAGPSGSAAQALRNITVLRYSLILFAMSLFAAMLSFSGLAASAADAAQLLCVVFVALAVLTGVVGLIDRG